MGCIHGTNHHAIAMMFVRLSVCLGRECIVIIRSTLVLIKFTVGQSNVLGTVIPKHVQPSFSSSIWNRGGVWICKPGKALFTQILINKQISNAYANLMDLGSILNLDLGCGLLYPHHALAHWQLSFLLIRYYTVFLIMQYFNLIIKCKSYNQKNLNLVTQKPRFWFWQFGQEPRFSVFVSCCHSTTLLPVCLSIHSSHLGL